MEHEKDRNWDSSCVIIAYIACICSYEYGQTAEAESEYKET